MQIKRNFFRGQSLVVTIVVLLLLWRVAAAAVNKAFLPPPIAAGRAFLRLAENGSLWRHTSASLLRLFWAITAGFFPAAVLGLTAGRSPRLNALLSPLIYLIHPLPKAAFLPIIMLFLGLGDASKVFLLGFTIFSQVLIAARDASARVPETSVLAVRSMGAGPFAVFRHVILPSALPDLCTGLRVSLGTATAVLFLAETFATDAGLGYLIVDAWTRVAYPEMFAAILSLSLLGLLLFGAVDVLERIICPWRKKGGAL
ncbi:MAG: ABC transporter permease [Treponema sp.]|jgi:NitT/TauT family transport system permease protein|nr:ABC transporter permease [Treponema sp.]